VSYLWSYLTLLFLLIGVAGIVVIFIVVVAFLGWLADLAAQYVGKDASGVQCRSRAVSSALFMFFMLSVSAISVVVGAPDIPLTTDQVPIAFWFAVPPSCTIGTLPSLEGWQRKCMCVILSMFVYSMVSIVTFWIYAPGVRHAIDIWWVMFARNDVLFLYAVALISGHTTEIRNQILALARLLLVKIGLIFKRAERVLKLRKR
jgi:hypothetical protein